MACRTTVPGAGRFQGGHLVKNSVAIVLKSKNMKKVKIHFNFFIMPPKPLISSKKQLFVSQKLFFALGGLVEFIKFSAF